MQLMVTDLTRRKLLRSAVGAMAAVPVGGLLTGCTNSRPGVERQPRLIGCRRTHSGAFGVVVASQQGLPIYRFALPARGHGIAVQPAGSLAAAFARRPGQYLQIFDFVTGEEWPIRAVDPMRHYYGHGAFSADGQYLYATEGNSSTSEGVIGVYEVNPGLPKVAEFSGFGLGPHEVVLADNKTLAVGVGGVHTRGRTPLNLDSMQPALVYLDAQTGDLLEQAVMADKRLSIRHLSVTDSGEIACGQQYRGEPENAAPLVALHRRGGELRHLFAEEEQWLRFNHYIASIASVDGYLLATSPRGNCYGIWHEASRKLVEVRPLIDASGVGVMNGQWLVGSGSGKVVSVRPPADVKAFPSPVLWDNHWSVLPA